MARKLFDTFVQMIPKFRVIHFFQVEAQHGELIRQPSVRKQIVQGWNQFAPGQIAASSKNHQFSWTGRGVSHVVVSFAIAQCLNSV